MNSGQEQCLTWRTADVPSFWFAVVPEQFNVCTTEAATF